MDKEEAMKILKDFHDKSALFSVRTALETLHPELKESEDERLRKWLIALIRSNEYGSVSDAGYMPCPKPQVLAWLERQGGKKSIWHNEDEEPQRDSLILIIMQSGTPIVVKMIEPNHTFNHGERWAYIDDLLEKQGEQNDSDVKDYNSIDPHFAKPIDKVEPNFKVGDWVVWDNKISCHIDNIYQGKESLMYTITDDHNMTRSYSVKGFDNNAHLWTIKDAKDSDVLAYVTDEGDLWIMIYWSLYEPYEGHVHYHALLVNDEFYDKGTCCICINDLKPATKEQRDTLFAKMKEAGYEWDAEKKKLLSKPIKYNSNPPSIDKKSDWSEEDERNLNDAILFIETGTYSLDKDNLINWLKSLRPQPKQEWSEEDKKMFKSLKTLLNDASCYSCTEGVDKILAWLKQKIGE